jgi:hypothetical protein
MNVAFKKMSCDPCFYAQAIEGDLTAQDKK